MTTVIFLFGFLAGALATTLFIAWLIGGAR